MEQVAKHEVERKVEQVTSLVDKHKEIADRIWERMVSALEKISKEVNNVSTNNQGSSEPEMDL